MANIKDSQESDSYPVAPTSKLPSSIKSVASPIPIRVLPVTSSEGHSLTHFNTLSPPELGQEGGPHQSGIVSENDMK